MTEVSKSGTGRFPSLLLHLAGTNYEQAGEADRLKYQLLGGTVLITSGMAFIGMAFSLWQVFIGGTTDYSNWLPVLITCLAACYALTILTIDRLMLVIPIRPVEFRQAAANSSLPTLAHAPKTRIAFGVIPRVLLACVIGVLIAEPLLVLIFRESVEARVQLIAAAAQQSAVQEVENRYAPLLKEIAKKTPEQISLEDKQGRAAELAKSIATEEQVVDSEQKLANGEAAGLGQLGNNILTSRVGCGPQCEHHLYLRDQANIRLGALKAEQGTLNGEIEGLKKNIGTQESDRITRQNTLLKEREEEKDRAAAGAAFKTGLLVRIQALHQLANATYPLGEPTNSGEQSTAAAGSQASSNSAHKYLEAERTLGLTPMGLAIWLVRIFLVLIDSMPIVGKVWMSLRDKRPVDSAQAVEANAQELQHRLVAQTDFTSADLISSSMHEARRAAFDKAGGVWISGGFGNVFVGPHGSITLPPDINLQELDGLVVTRNQDGTWSVSTRGATTPPTSRDES